MGDEVGWPGDREVSTEHAELVLFLREVLMQAFDATGASADTAGLPAFGEPT